MLLSSLAQRRFPAFVLYSCYHIGSNLIVTSSKRQVEVRMRMKACGKTENQNENRGCSLDFKMKIIFQNESCAGNDFTNEI